jgi:hypothetical protein
MKIVMIDTTAPPEIKKYLTHGFIPVRSAAFAAIFLVVIMTLPAHANSVAKIPNPAKTIRIPGPGPINATAPTTVIPPPMIPIITRHTMRPTVVFLIHERKFILF